MQIDYQSLIAVISQFVWPLFRIGGLMITIPVIASALVPGRVRIVFTMSMALMVATLIPKQFSLLNFEPAYILFMIEELLLGMIMGLILQMVFQVFIIGGQIVAMQTGLGFATMVDPASHASVPLVSQFYLMMLSLVFLSMNGHLAVFAALIDSYRLMPVGQVHLDNGTIGACIQFSGWMMKESVLVAIPAIMSLLVVSLSFGIMTKVAPQLNIFSIGFPFTLLMGILIIKLTLPGVAAQISDSLEQGMQLILGMIR